MPYSLPGETAMKGQLRVLILVPTAMPGISGNAVTAERWKNALIEKGLNVKILATEHIDASALLDCIENFRPDVMHAHHVSRAGSLTLDLRIRDHCQRLPLVVSPAGTDLSPLDAPGNDWENIVPHVCRRACVIITQSEWTAKKLSELFPDVKSRIIHVPKALSWFGEDRFDLRKTLGWQQEYIIFFQPAGIRPVKRNLETLRAFQEVHSSRPRARLVFAGPSLDPGYTALFQEDLERFSAFARWIPVIPHGAMRSAYESADVVVNASSSEGLSNALLEAIASGRAVLVSDIPGNRWPVMGGAMVSPCGLLFNLNDRNDFIQKAIQLIDDYELRKWFGLAGGERAALWPSPEEEASGLVHAYEQAIVRQREKANTINHT
jgi:glycosyltransferase involved in cell wall biosynthesis